MPKFTASQTEAIQNRRGSMVVSAGAGSGKTTVMTRRILESVLEGNDINRFLIVTYTKAAAADVREKLYKALMQAQTEHPENRHIARQLLSLPAADISTVHAFCFSRIKQSFSLLGLSPKVRAADETETKAIMEKAMDRALSAGYESEIAGFEILTDTLCGRKDDRRLASAMLHLYRELRVYPYMWDFADSLAAEAQAEGEKHAYEQTEVCKTVTEDAYRIILSLREQSEYLCREVEEMGETACLPALYGFTEELDTLISLFPAGYTGLREYLSTVKNPSLPRKGIINEENKAYIAEQKNKLHDVIKNLRKTCFALSAEHNLRDIRRNGVVLRAAVDFLKEFDKIYTALKKEEGVIDFADQEHLMLSLLEQNGEPTRMCLDLREYFTQVYIDEYQYTNPLQDRIFTLLSHDNRFMVGDVKQSIYRFRSAHPDIFKNYCSVYGKAENTTKVVLRENFRCDKNIIDFCNRTFSASESIKEELNYGEESLIFAKNENTGEHPVNLTLLLCDKEQTAEQKQESEASYIATQIKQLVTQTKNDGSPITYGDIAVLFSALVSNAPIYMRVFEQAGIPVRTEKSENLLTKPEILLAISLLKAVDNPTADIPLASVMRSPLLGFNADEMYKIRRCAKTDCLYDCLLAASAAHKEGRLKNRHFRVYPAPSGATPIPRVLPKIFTELITPGLSRKCKDAVTRLHMWRVAAEGVPAHRFIWQLYSESGLTNAVLTEKSGEKQHRNLMLLYEYARRYEESSFKGLNAFIKHLDETEQLSEAKPADDGGNTVKLMTVHSSKGLEFPAVFLADTDRKFNLRAEGDCIVRKDGIGIKFSEYGGLLTKGNCVLDSLRIKETAEQKAEEARKLYVALTRARERLYITAKYTDENPAAGDLHTGESHSAWLLNAVWEDTAFCRVNRVSTEGLSGEQAAPAGREAAPPKTDFAAPLRFAYTHGGTATPAKISVSQIRIGLLEEEEYVHTVSRTSVLARPEFLHKKMPTPADRGTANHLFMQFADFSAAELRGSRYEADRLAEKGYITLEQRDIMNFSALDKFFASDLYKRMVKAKRIYREKRFSLEASDIYVGGEGKEQILVQGVIDCFFENPDGSYTVVDYKTDSTTDKAELIARHKAQLGFYKIAVEKMTVGSVSQALIYSFSMGKEITVEV